MPADPALPTTIRHSALRIGLAAALGTALFVRLATAVHRGALPHEGDVNRFYRLARAGGLPSIDYPVEYPILTLGVLKLLVLVAASRLAFGHAVVALAVASDAAVAGALFWGWGAEATCVYLISSTFLLHLLDARLDLLSTAVATLAIAAWHRGRSSVSGGAVAIATLAKLWSLPLALVGMAARHGRHRRSFTAAFLAVSGSVGVAWLLLSGMAGPVQVLTFRHAQGWEIESLPGLVMVWLHPARAHMESGAYRIGTVAPWVRLGSSILGLAVAGWAVAQGSRQGRLGAAWVAGVGVMLLTSSLLSPQFVIWLVPAAAIAWVEGDIAIALLVALASALTGLEMHDFHAVRTGQPLEVAVVMLRNALLLAAVVLAVVRVFRNRDDLRLVESVAA